MTPPPPSRPAPPAWSVALDRLLWAAGVARPRIARPRIARPRIARPRIARPPAPPRSGRWVRLEHRPLSDPIRRARDLARLDPGAVATIDDLAAEAGLSRYHFARRFRDETGQTPWRFVQEARVDHAVRLLEQGGAPARVAHESGFADQSHLTRSLRQRDGRTPAEVRRGEPRPSPETPPADVPSADPPTVDTQGTAP